MLRTEVLNDRTHNFSDAGYKIRQIETGVLYDDALDIVPCPYTYEETDVPIETNPNPPGNLEDSARYLIDQNFVQIPEPHDQNDYFGENEPEPNYFGEQEDD